MTLKTLPELGSRERESHKSSSTPIARTGRSPPFSSVFLSLLSPFYLAIYLARRSSVARGTLTLMISSISGTSPLLVPFSWPSSAILSGIFGRNEVERRHFCLAAALASANDGDGGDSLPLVTREEPGAIEERRERNGGSRNTDAARVAPRSRRWRRLWRDVTNKTPRSI